MILTCLLALTAPFFIKGFDTYHIAAMLVSTAYLKYPNVPKFENTVKTKLFYDDYVSDLLDLKIKSRRPRISLKKYAWARDKLKDDWFNTQWNDCDSYDFWGAKPKFWYYQRHETKYSTLIFCLILYRQLTPSNYMMLNVPLMHSLLISVPKQINCASMLQQAPFLPLLVPSLERSFNLNQQMMISQLSLIRSLHWFVPRTIRFCRWYHPSRKC